MTKPNKTLIALLAIIFVLVVYIIFKSGPSDDESFDPTALREEIRIKDSTATYWEQEATAWETMAGVLGNKSDSLGKLKPTIKHYYHEKYTFNANANTFQLDSVIRASW